MILHHKILGVVTLLYLLIFFAHVFYFAVRSKKVLALIGVLFYVTFGLHTAGLALRWIESYGAGMGHVPLSNFYESLIFYAWSVCGLLIALRIRGLVGPAITVCGALVSLCLMGFASISPSIQKNIEPLVPALQSNWLHIHVITCFVAYAAFSISFICSILFLVGPKGIIPPRETLEEINYKSIIIGFPMLTSGILTGAVWAHYAWGSYWSWDPKETWSLITWIVYALFLHGRRVSGWKGKTMALVSIAGFLSVIVTYFAVNFILSGLHSYAT
jgi:ABC-type transport system involved in cytochrome c biogenesis permease subunit